MSAHPLARATDTSDNGADKNSDTQGRPMHNVIVFGDTGAGKSSVLNMLEGNGNVGSDKAGISDRAAGVTFSNTPYMKTISGRTFKVFDTVGLSEATELIGKQRDVFKGLQMLISRLDGGVSLLVYVMRGPRIQASAKRTYDIFYDAFCQKQVPVVIIINGLENRENLDGWWEENEHRFILQGMLFKGYACITSTMGKLRRDGVHCHEAEYSDSREKVEKLIYDSYKPDPWIPPASWLETSKARIRAALGETGAGNSWVLKILRIVGWGG